MSRIHDIRGVPSTERITATGHAVRCDECGNLAAVLDSTDLTRTWTARVLGTRIEHYCPDCDPGPSAAERAGAARMQRRREAKC